MKVKFVPQNIEFEIKPGQSVMHCAQDAGLYVKSVCKGVPSCAECRVRVVDGEHNVLPPGSEELSLIGTGHFIDHRRLSCQLKCFGDITVDMNEQVQKQAGLIGGRKTKQKNIKDDRVEDAPAIRLNDGARGEEEGSRPPRGAQRPRPTRDERAGEPPAKGSAAEKLAREPREPKGPRPPRPEKGGGGGQAAGGQEGRQNAADPNRKKKRRRGRGGGGGGERAPGAPNGGPSGGAPSAKGPTPVAKPNNPQS